LRVIAGAIDISRHRKRPLVVVFAAAASRSAVRMSPRAAADLSVGITAAAFDLPESDGVLSELSVAYSSVVGHPAKLTL